MGAPSQILIQSFSEWCPQSQSEPDINQIAKRMERRTRVVWGGFPLVLREEFQPTPVPNEESRGNVLLNLDYFLAQAEDHMILSVSEPLPGVCDPCQRYIFIVEVILFR